MVFFSCLTFLIQTTIGYIRLCVLKKEQLNEQSVNISTIVVITYDFKFWFCQMIIKGVRRNDEKWNINAIGFKWFSPLLNVNVTNMKTTTINEIIQNNRYEFLGVNLSGNFFFFCCPVSSCCVWCSWCCWFLGCSVILWESANCCISWRFKPNSIAFWRFRIGGWWIEINWGNKNWK